MCFSLLLSLIFPLFNVQSGNIFDLDGISSIYFVKTQDGKLFYEKQEKLEFSQIELSNLEGVILTFEGKETLDIVNKLNMKIVREEMVDDIKIIYGYTDLYADFIYLDGKQTNVQLLKRQNEVIAGFPIILSGY